MKNKNIIFLLTATLLALNIFLLFEHKKANKNFEKIITENFFIKAKYNELISQIGSYTLMQGKLIEIKNEMLHSFVIKNQNSSSFLFINQNICEPCLDLLILEFEKLRIDSISDIKNIKLIILNKDSLSNHNAIANLFDNYYNGCMNINVDEIRFPNNIDLPDMFYIEINRELRASSFLKFDTNNLDFLLIFMKNLRGLRPIV